MNRNPNWCGSNFRTSWGRSDDIMAYLLNHCIFVTVKTICLVLILFSIMACNKSGPVQQATQKSLPPTQRHLADSFVVPDTTTTYEELTELEDTLAQLTSPRIFILAERPAHYAVLCYSHNGQIKRANIFGDACFGIHNISLDTIYLSGKKVPEVIIHYTSSCFHRYGGAYYSGFWGTDRQTEIWDVAQMKLLFAQHHFYEWVSDERSDPEYEKTGEVNIPEEEAEKYSDPDANFTHVEDSNEIIIDRVARNIKVRFLGGRENETVLKPSKHAITYIYKLDTMIPVKEVE